MFVKPPSGINENKKLNNNPVNYRDLKNNNN